MHIKLVQILLLGLFSTVGYTATGREEVTMTITAVVAKGLDGHPRAVMSIRERSGDLRSCVDMSRQVLPNVYLPLIREGKFVSVSEACVYLNTSGELKEEMAAIVTPNGLYEPPKIFDRWDKSRDNSRSIEEPLRHIVVENAGEDTAVVLNQVKGGKGAYGHNAGTGEYVDMIDAGIVDPAKVMRLALKNAASVSGLLFTTEVMIAEAPKEEEHSRGAPGGGMGGMGM